MVTSERKCMPRIIREIVTAIATTTATIHATARIQRCRVCQPMITAHTP